MTGAAILTSPLSSDSSMLVAGADQSCAIACTGNRIEVDAVAMIAALPKSTFTSVDGQSPSLLRILISKKSLLEQEIEGGDG
jgi:hypothetical protein